MIKKILTFVILIMCFYGCKGQTQGTTQAFLMCHNSGAGTLTSFIEVRAYNATNKTYRLVGRYRADGTAYTPGAGTISFGACTTDNNCLVKNETDHDDIIFTTKTYPANTINSLSFTVRKGSANVTINGKTTNYPQYFTEKYTAPNGCSFISNAITIVATDTVKVAIIK